MQGQNAVLNTITLPPGATQTQARLVLDGVRGAIFLYANGGPVGTLAGSWAIAAGTDPYENTYPQGFSVNIGTITGGTISGVTITGSTITGTVFQGTDFVLNSSGLFFYSGTPALGNLIVSVTPNSGVDGFGNAYAQGLTAYNIAGGVEFIINMNTLGPSSLLGMTISTLGSGAPAIGGGIYGNVSSSANEVLITSGQSNAGSVQATIELIDQFVSGITNGEISISAGFISLGNGPTLQIDDNHLATTIINAPAAPSPPSLGPALFGLNGTLTTERPSGRTGNIPLTLASSTTHTVTGASFLNLTDIYNIQANDANVNTVYRLTAGGTLAQGTTLELPTFQLAAFGASVGAFSIGTAQFVVSTTYAWKMIAEIVIASTGVTGSMLGSIDGTVSVVGANEATVAGSSQSAGGFGSRISLNTIDTTSAAQLALQAKWGATTGSPTISGLYSVFERLASLCRLRSAAGFTITKVRGILLDRYVTTMPPGDSSGGRGGGVELSPFNSYDSNGQPWMGIVVSDEAFEFRFFFARPAMARNAVRELYGKLDQCARDCAKMSPQLAVANQGGVISGFRNPETRAPGSESGQGQDGAPS